MRRSPSSAGPFPAPSGVAVGDDQLHVGRFHGTTDLGPGLAVGDDAVDTDQVVHLGENRINPPRQSLESDRPPLWACNRHR